MVIKLLQPSTLLCLAQIGISNGLAVISEAIKPLQPVGQEAQFKFESKFEPLPVIWQSLRSLRLFQKIIEGLEFKINSQAFGAALWLACAKPESQQQSLLAATGSVEENMLPLLRYLLSSRVNKVLMLCNW